VVDKLVSFAVNTPAPFMKLDEGRESIVQASGWFLVREAGQAPKVSPVGTGGITAETAHKFLGCLRAQFTIQHRSVIKPRLKIPS